MERRERVKPGPPPVLLLSSSLSLSPQLSNKQLQQQRHRHLHSRTVCMKMKMKVRSSCSVLAALILFLIFLKLHCEHTTLERRWHRNNRLRHKLSIGRRMLGSSLPLGIVHPTSDLELRPLWTSRTPTFRPPILQSNALLALAAGIPQKDNVHKLVQKFISANCSVILFHYDGHVNAWDDLHWSSKVIHVDARNQTKWWFAKRFLHPDIVSIYDYIFLWDEDIGVTDFDPGRFLEIMSSEHLEIAQPALDPELSEVHHRITIRSRKKKVHRRVYAVQGSLNCTDESTGPPCTGWIEGMAPVFSRAAWRCVWHLIQNDLVHGWGLDMKLGYCAQGDRTEKVGVIDSEYIVHHGIPTLGGPSAHKAPSYRTLDLRTHIRRQSTAELEVFQKRWAEAVRDDEGWDDPFVGSQEDDS